MTAVSPSARARARLQPWVQAARPIAHPMIFIPLLMGQAFALHSGGRFSGVYFLYAALFGVLFQLFLLYTNDHADEAIDRTNAQFWLSGGSRVLPEGKLSGQQLLAGARFVLFVLTGLVLFLAAMRQRPWLPVGLLLAVALCWAYNREPLRLSYRGYGEVLQGLGCGVVLPLIGFYLQQGTVREFPWGLLMPLYMVFHAGNIVTALPDYASDAVGGKRTVPVRHGEQPARWAAFVLLAVAYLSLAVIAHDLSPLALSIIVLPPLLVLIGLVGSGLVRRANVSEFPRCRAFVTGISASQAWFLCAWTGALFLEAP